MGETVGLARATATLGPTQRCHALRNRSRAARPAAPPALPASLQGGLADRPHPGGLLAVWPAANRPTLVGAVLPNDAVRLFVRGLDTYGPRPGAAFHDGTWTAGFDHARRAASLLRDGAYRRTDATHVAHLDKPAEFVDILDGYFRGDPR